MVDQINTQNKKIYRRLNSITSNLRPIRLKSNDNPYRDLINSASALRLKILNGTTQTKKLNTTERSEPSTESVLLNSSS